MTPSAKRRVSVSLDAELVAALEARGGSTLSAKVNWPLRAKFGRRKRQQALAELLDHMADDRGKLDTPEDETEISRYMRLLGGMAEEPGGDPADS